MEQNFLEVERRESVGRVSSAKLRRAHKTPAVLYGKRMRRAIPVILKADKLRTMLRRAGKGTNILITLRSDDEDLNNKVVVVKDYQIDPLTREVNHIDLYEVSREQRIRVRVPVELAGKPVGVTMGGILEHITREIEVECLPEKIPEKIVVDVSDLKMGHSVHIKELKPPEDVRVVVETDIVIAAVSVLKEEVAPVEAAPEVVEPEVVGKGKKVEEEVEKPEKAPEHAAGKREEREKE